MRSLRAEAVFQAWCESRRYQTEKFTTFKARCDAGEVPGLSPFDFQGPVSDTVHGDSEARPESERRDGSRRREIPSPGSAAEQPGTSERATTGEDREVTTPDHGVADESHDASGDGLSLFD